MEDNTLPLPQGSVLPPKVYAALSSWYSRIHRRDDISTCRIENYITGVAEDSNIYVVDIKITEYPYDLILRIFANNTDETFLFQQLYERGERPNFNVEEEIKKLTTWCQRYFNEHQVDIREMAELPVPYPNRCVGYRNIITTPNHPQGEFIDMITNEEGKIIDFQYIPEWWS
jgi:hypothetical protein